MFYLNIIKYAEHAWVIMICKHCDGMGLNVQGWRFCNQEAGNNCAVPARVTSPDHSVEGNGSGGEFFGTGEKINGRQQGNGTAYGSVTEVLLGNRGWVLVLLIKKFFFKTGLRMKFENHLMGILEIPTGQASCNLSCSQE